MTESQLRQKVVEIARSYYGCKESDGSHRKIIDLYNSHKPLARGYAMKYTDAWCSTYASAVAIQAGLTDIIPTECGCQRHIDLFQGLGSWVEDDAFVPSPGDYVFYDWQDGANYASTDNTGWSDHVGIVCEIDGATITVIEGNISNAVGYRKLAVNGRYIRGFGTPKYASKASAGGGTTAGTDVTADAAKYAATIIYSNEGNYGSVNKDDNGALSIGKVQWHASRALALMKTICSANTSQAKSVLGDALYSEIMNATSGAWNTRTVNAAEASAISSLLTTTQGKAAQDALAVTDITSYVKKGISYGLTDCGALIYFADGVNQYGTNSALWKNIVAKALEGAGDVAAMFEATKTLTSKYLTRRERVYKAVLALNLGGAPSPAPDQNKETVYTVKAGDTLSKIAAQYGTTYQKIAAYNGIANPDLIRVGQKIKIPAVTPGAQPAPKTYTVKKGDSLWAIAASQLGNGTRWPEIQKLNSLTSTTIHPGQILKIPV